MNAQFENKLNLIKYIWLSESKSNENFQIYENYGMLRYGGLLTEIEIYHY